MTEAKTQETIVEDKFVESPLLKEILESTTNLKPENEAYDMTMIGLHKLMSQLTSSDSKVEKISKAIIDKMIGEIDKQIGLQLDVVLHAEKFQFLESAWCSLKFLVDRTDFRENINLSIVNISKEDLLDDFEDAPEITKSGLYQHLYVSEYGQFGGQPYAAVIGNYDFGPSGSDIQLLRYLASVSTMAHAPFIGAAAPSMFGVDTYEEISKLKELEDIFESPIYNGWKSLRESEDSRYLALTLPRFLLRMPYGKETKPLKAFAYEEDVSKSHTHYLWGNTAFAFAGRLTDSFAKYRWTSNVIGPKGGGAVENLPVHNYEALGEIQTKIPTEILLSERKEYELSELGFIGLTMRKGADNAVFFSANSIQKPKRFPDTEEGQTAAMNYKLGTQLPYMLIISRLSHYLKVIQRENIGDWKTPLALKTELSKWLDQYVVRMDNPLPGVRSRKPLKEAVIDVTEVPGEKGWYKIDIQVMPHFKYMGSNFTLSLVGKLDKAG